MSIIRSTEGEHVTEIEKGWTVFTDEFEGYAGQFSHFTADEGTIIGYPKTDEGEETIYFKEGKWCSDFEGNNPITKAGIGQVVYFHIKTQNITDPNAKVQLQLYDEDGGAGGDADPITIRNVVGKDPITGEDILGEIVKEQPVINNKVVYNLTLSDGLAIFIEDDFGDEIELFFECGYKEEQKIKLPLTSDLYLNVEICDKNVVQSFNNKQYGSCDFYRFRYDDFMRRHKHCKHMPPVYYFGEMRKSNFWSVVDDIEEWWTPSLTEEMKQVSVSVQEVEKQGNKYKPVPSSSYGFKYCVRFSEILRPKLTIDGQNWLDEVRFYLQEYIELGVIKKEYISNYNKSFNENFEPSWIEKNILLETDEDIKNRRKELREKYYTNIEIDNDRFQEFAFASHPDAYNPLAMSRLPADDLLKIVVTPDMKEWMGAATWEQAWIMANNLNYEKIIGKTIERLFEIYVLGK